MMIDDCVIIVVCLFGATENAGVENAGALKMQGVENTAP